MSTMVGIAAPRQDGSNTEPIAVGFGQRPTIPPSTSAPAMPITTEAVMMRALDLAERVGTDVARNPAAWRLPVAVLLIAVALTVSIGAIALWGRHATSSNTEILDRLDALEQAHDDRIDHDAWVVDALQALSSDKPLPPPPKPTRRKLSQDHRSR